MDERASASRWTRGRVAMCIALVLVAIGIPIATTLGGDGDRYVRFLKDRPEEILVSAWDRHFDAGRLPGDIELELVGAFRDPHKTLFAMAVASEDRAARAQADGDAETVDLEVGRFSLAAASLLMVEQYRATGGVHDEPTLRRWFTAVCEFDEEALIAQDNLGE